MTYTAIFVIGTEVYVVMDRIVSQCRLQLPDGNYYLPTTDETIPADMATPSPDDRFHHCTYYPVANDVEGYPVWGSKPKTRCFFAPMHSS
jgi:hypothetical protein